MLASLAITPEGLPLGLTATKLWTLDRFKKTSALKRKISPTRMPIAGLRNLRCTTELAGPPERYVHIDDRETDNFELFCLSQELGAHFLIEATLIALQRKEERYYSKWLRRRPAGHTAFSFVMIKVM